MPIIIEESNPLTILFTAWVNAIQNAEIIQLDRNEDWTDDEKLIQVKRMTRLDLNDLKENIKKRKKDEATKQVEEEEKEAKKLAI